jgi:hypothetical protein
MVCRDADGGERGLQSFAESLDEAAGFLGRHHDGQQTSIADTEHHLDPANADQIGVPVAEDSVRLRRFRIDLGVENDYCSSTRQVTANPKRSRLALCAETFRGAPVA